MIYSPPILQPDWSKITSHGTADVNLLPMHQLLHRVLVNLHRVSVSIGYITRWRSLCDLHNRGPQARGSANHIENDTE